MSDAKIYLEDDRPGHVAAAARRLDTRAYRDGQISRVAWENTMRASDTELMEKRNANRKRDARLRKKLAQRRLQLLQVMILDLEQDRKAAGRSGTPRRQPE